MKKNNIVSLTNFLKVLYVYDSRNKIRVKNIHTGLEFDIIGTELIKRLSSADDYESEEFVSKTELAKLLTESYNVAMSVKFKKANGQSRIVRCKLLSNEPLMGRSYVEDLDIEEENNTRLVDHRTLEYIILNGTKYVTKS